MSCEKLAVSQFESLLVADFVEKLALQAGAARAAIFDGWSRWLLSVSSGRHVPHRNELSELPEVLSGGCEVELVARAVWAA